MFESSMKILSLLVCSAVMMLGMLAPAPAVAQDCAAGWLPSTYEELSGRPMNHRWAIFSTLTAAQKSAQWQRHLELYLEAHERSSNCTVKRDACGTLWAFDCNGSCKSDEEQIPSREHGPDSLPDTARADITRSLFLGTSSSRTLTWRLL